MTSLNAAIARIARNGRSWTAKVPQLATLPTDAAKDLVDVVGRRTDGLSRAARARVARRARTRLGHVSSAVTRATRRSARPAARVSVQRSAGLGSDRRPDDLLVAHAHGAPRRGRESPRLLRRAVRRSRIRRAHLVHGPGALGHHAGRRLRHAVGAGRSTSFAVARLHDARRRVAALGLGDTWADWRSRARSNR